MLRRKYWFPTMNASAQLLWMPEIATNIPHTEPAKMTELSDRPWDTVEIDFCSPFGGTEYALAITDQYSRYPEVEFIYSTSIGPTRKKMKKTIVIHGIPQIVKSDNGPPFHSAKFETFSHETGFRHKKVTPRHPKAQGQDEGFNKLFNKTAAIARETGTDLHEVT